MKKYILLLLCFFTGNLKAEITLDQYLQIEFPEEFFPNYCELEEDSQSKDACNVYVDKRLGVNADFWCSKSVCNSIIDSSIYFFTHDITHSECYLLNENCLAMQFFVLSGATHSLMDVIRDELTNYQRCHFLCITQEQLDSIFAEMERILIPELEKKGGTYHNKHFYIKPSLETEAFLLDCKNGGSCWLGGSGDIEQIIDERNSVEPLPYHMDFAARLRAENGSLIVPADLEGRTFSLFRLNGSVLRKGELRNNMPLPHQPAILRVEGFGDMYLK